jgi:hypothetical protein
MALMAKRLCTNTLKETGAFLKLGVPYGYLTIGAVLFKKDSVADVEFDPYCDKKNST